MLRTKAMREREEQRERRKYNYTLLRIRLPDGNLLQGQRICLKSPLNVDNPSRAEVEGVCVCVIQGTFYAWDRLPVLFGFVRESLVDGWQPFELIAPGGVKLQESEDVALAESNLVGWLTLSLLWRQSKAVLLRPCVWDSQFYTLHGCNIQYRMLKSMHSSRLHAFIAG